jgi:nicotinate-nucleotide adenylyltransferase
VNPHGSAGPPPAGGPLHRERPAHSGAGEGVPPERRVGILGGTFDPIHNGHLDAGAAAMTALGLTELQVVPAHIPPHRPQARASGYHRFAMVALAVSGRAGWRGSDLELRHEAPSYTSATFERLHQAGYGPRELFFVVGADAFVEVRTWRDYPQILGGANFAVVSRPGHPVGDLPSQLPELSSRFLTPSSIAARGVSPSIFLIDAQTAQVSSTAIRLRRRSGQSIADLVPPGVRQHIEQHDLYSPAASEGRDGGPAQNHVAGNLYGQD